MCIDSQKWFMRCLDCNYYWMVLWYAKWISCLFLFLLVLYLNGVLITIFCFFSFTSWIKTHSVWTQHGCCCCYCCCVCFKENDLRLMEVHLSETVLGTYAKKNYTINTKYFIFLLKLPHTDSRIWLDFFSIWLTQCKSVWGWGSECTLSTI